MNDTVRRSTVSILWAYTLRPLLATWEMHSSLPLKSGVRHSIIIFFLESFFREEIVFAIWAAPKSGRSSRSTLVRTT